MCIRDSVYTAYEYLERRFDAKTRTLTSFLFLVSRAMATGVVISAPAVVLSVMLGLSVTSTCLLLALPTAFYTMFGGVQAVAWTDVKQMVLIVGGLLAAVVMLVMGLPDGVGLDLLVADMGGPVMLDAGSLQDSLLNLILNARDAIVALSLIHISEPTRPY